MRASIRRAAVAGTWYPGTAPELAAAVDRQLAKVDDGPTGGLVALVAPHAGIVPLVMGHQTADTARALGDALASVLKDRRALLIASTDLSHYHDAATASALDAVVIDSVGRFDDQGLQRALDVRPEHACGGGPTVAVMRAARLLGARDAVVLAYADSGDVSGDKSSVVGYLAAAMGNFSS